MANRKVYHVTPAPERRWKVERESGNAAGTHTTKTDAIDQAKDLAKSAPLGQVIIHGRDGRIQTEHTYGKDPRRTKG